MVGGWGAGVRVGPGSVRVGVIGEDGVGRGSGRWCCGWTGKVCVVVDYGEETLMKDWFVTAGDVADPVHVLRHAGEDSQDFGLRAAVTKTHDSNHSPSWINQGNQGAPWVSLWKESDDSCWDSFCQCCLGDNSLKLTRWWLRTCRPSLYTVSAMKHMSYKQLVKLIVNWNVPPAGL